MIFDNDKNLWKIILKNIKLTFFISKNLTFFVTFANLDYKLISKKFIKINDHYFLKWNKDILQNENRKSLKHEDEDSAKLVVKIFDFFRFRTKVYIELLLFTLSPIWTVIGESTISFNGNVCYYFLITSQYQDQSNIPLISMIENKSSLVSTTKKASPEISKGSIRHFSKGKVEAEL